VPTGYKIASGAAAVAGLSTALINASVVQTGLSRRTSGWMGVGAGAMGLLLLVTVMDEGDEYAPWRMLNGGIGMIAAGVGLSALFRAPEPAIRAAARFTGAPLIAPGGRPGFLLNLTF
jgi:hypothetical protein